MEKLNKSHFKVKTDRDDCVYVLYRKDVNSPFKDGELDGFMDIWVNDDDILPSPFSSLEEAETYAKYIVKILSTVMNE